MVTPLYRQLLPAVVDLLLEHISSVFAKSVTAGAHLSVIAGLKRDPSPPRGSFFCSGGNIFDYPDVINVTSEGATLLWNASEAIVANQ